MACITARVVVSLLSSSKAGPRYARSASLPLNVCTRPGPRGRGGPRGACSVAAWTGKRGGEKGGGTRCGKVGYAGSGAGKTSRVCCLGCAGGADGPNTPRYWVAYARSLRRVILDQHVLRSLVLPRRRPPPRVPYDIETVSMSYVAWRQCSAPVSV